MRLHEDRPRLRHHLVPAIAVLLSPSVANARDEQPFPAPLPCTLDAPVRVASDDTLKRFSALDGCLPERILVAPLERSLPLRSGITIEPPRAPRRSSAQAGRGRARIGETKVEQASLGTSNVRVVRIMPTLPPAPPPPPPVDVPATIRVDDLAVSMPPGTNDDSVLGLRPAKVASPYDALIADAARRHRVDPLILHSVILQESHYRPQVVSRAGARGLMQIMPMTGSDLGIANPVLLLDPATNINAGARLLRRLWTRMGGRFDLVLAAYNSGEGAVRRFGMTVPPYAETRSYVARIQDSYRALAVGAGILKAN